MGRLLADADDDGVCDEVVLTGCTDPDACNYVPEANTNDSSCTYAEQYYDCEGNCLMDTDMDGVCDELEVAGCTDETACNYNELATDDDGMCEYAEEFYDCEGNCLNDADEDGVCDELEVAGCRYPSRATTIRWRTLTMAHVNSRHASGAPTLRRAISMLPHPWTTASVNSPTCPSNCCWAPATRTLHNWLFLSRLTTSCTFNCNPPTLAPSLLGCPWMKD